MTVIGSDEGAVNVEERLADILQGLAEGANLKGMSAVNRAIYEQHLQNEDARAEGFADAADRDRAEREAAEAEAAAKAKAEQKAKAAAARKAAAAKARAEKAAAAEEAEETE